MASPNDSSNVPSRNGTPNPVHNSRFTSQAATAEDLLKNQTVGLVHLSDFRKRRAEALEQKEREASDRSLGRFASGRNSGAATPSDGTSTPQPPNKKKKKNPAKGKLSFDVEDEDGGEDIKVSKPPALRTENGEQQTRSPSSEEVESVTKRLGPNASVAIAPKIMTKSALLKDAQARDQLRKEFLIMQEAVKATEFLIPFVFYDGTNSPGGRCKVKKGDHIWLFLDRSRKLGAKLAVGGKGDRSSSRREWARVGVDDLMLVRGNIIIPHHYEFYYFIVNKTLGPSSAPLFPYSAQPTASPLPGGASLDSADPSNYDPLSRPSSKPPGSELSVDDAKLEGADEEPIFTKVVDRRWYERNKHIFPASVWEEFDPSKDYSKGMRRDGKGNSFFF